MEAKLKEELKELNAQIESLKEKRDQLAKSIDSLDSDLGPYEFRCQKCLKVHKQSMYCVAQIAQGHSIIHTCDCGNKTFLEGYDKYKKRDNIKK